MRGLRPDLAEDINFMVPLTANAPLVLPNDWDLVMASLNGGDWEHMVFTTEAGPIAGPNAPPVFGYDICMMEFDCD